MFAHLRRRIADAFERYAQVALDVIIERFERRDVKEMNPTLPSLCEGR